MSHEPEATPVAPAHSGTPIPTGVGPDEVVPLDWLDDPRLAEQAARIDRLAADFDLVTTLGLEGFEGEDWDVFEEELGKYGLAVIGGWTRRRAIFGKYAERGFGGLPEPFRDFTDDEVEELALETVKRTRTAAGVVVVSYGPPRRRPVVGLVGLPMITRSASGRAIGWSI